MSAEAAADQARYAAWQTIAGFIGVLVGFGTLTAAIVAARWAKKAAFETERGAAAAEKAIDNSRISEERQSRAYLFVESISLGRAVKGPNKNHPGAVILIRNTGKTPAFDVLHHSEVRVLRIADQSKLSLPDHLERKSETDIASGGTINAIRSIGRVLTRTELRAIRYGEMAIFCHGRIEYTDSFGLRRRTNYRNYYSGVWPTEGMPLMTFCDDGNEAA